jgi:phage gp46-like protein
MTDVHLYQTNDGGEIDVVAGQVVMDDELSTSVFISLLGGNLEDSGSDGDVSIEWWGNKLATDEAEKLRSETQSLLASIPVTSGNLRRFQDAAQRDLAWMVTAAVATAVAVRAVITSVNKLRFDVAIQVNGEWLKLGSFTASGNTGN